MDTENNFDYHRYREKYGYLGYIDKITVTLYTENDYSYLGYREITVTLDTENDGVRILHMTPTDSLDFISCISGHTSRHRLKNHT